MKKYLPLILILAMAPLLWGHGISEADKLAIVAGGNLRYLWLGAIHMVTGYDHLLFLFGVVFYLTGFKDILKFITAFTLGHSITLIFATFMKITADFYLVDAVIALSVCYKAFDNLDGFRKYLKVNPPHLLAMVFGFGLIHGFGLSTRLQELPLPAQGLLARILSFNVGVELGQVAALTVIVALLAGWRRTESFRKAGRIANMLLLAAGLALFIYQINGYLRGGGHHHEDSHEENHGDAEGDHSHGEDAHSHGEEDAHSHDVEPAPHREDSLAHGTDSHAHDGQSVQPPHAHPEDTVHAHGESGHSHSHAEKSGGEAKVEPPRKNPTNKHSHEGSAPHVH